MFNCFRMSSFFLLSFEDIVFTIPLHMAVQKHKLQPVQGRSQELERGEGEGEGEGRARARVAEIHFSRE